ncbi:FAD-dependent oxidoreductase [Amycolatopsis sp. NPDC054798]
MSAASTAEYDVLVAGAGPVGLTAAHELTRRGIRVRVVDRASGPATTSRATATHARTLETYHQMGLIDDVLPRGQRVDHFTVHRAGRQLIRLDTEYSSLPTRYPFTLQVDQVTTEKILRDRLRGLGVRIDWSTELVHVAPHDDRVDVRLRDAGGETHRQSVPWLIGADGGHSTVRRVLGLPLLGDSTETWLIADAVLDAPLPRDSLHWMHTGDGTVLLVPFPDPGKWRLLDTADTSGEDDPVAVGRRFERKISRALGRAVRVSVPTWVSVFTIQQRMVPRMRAGRCFVAGDAAHVHSPASGQGLNTGVQDACNLAWKLADVIRGHAREELLDSYGAERVPIGETLLGSTRTATVLLALRNAAAPVLLPAGLGLLNTLKPVKRKIERKIMAHMSGLALRYPESPLSLRPDEEREGIEPGQRVSCAERDVREHPGWQALCTELTDPRWTLLVFAGPGELPPAAELAADFGRAVSVRTVSASAADSGPAGVLLDPDGAVASAFGAGPGDYALIRPDGYLAGKGALVDAGRMRTVLGSVHLLAETDSDRTAAR